VDAADRLEEFRRSRKDFVGLSFDTISGSGANGAIIHYQPERETCAMVDPKKLYLCDSGAQYRYVLTNRWRLSFQIVHQRGLHGDRDGTTDVTRTYHFTNPSPEESTAFTLVLKGHIQIDTAVFPKGTTGYILDVLARTALWRHVGSHPPPF